MTTDQKLVVEETETRRFSGLHADVTHRILSVFYDVYNDLGGGFIESVYHGTLALALTQAGLTVASEVPISVYFRGTKVGDFFADLTVNECVLLELKAVSVLDAAHHKQMLNYLRATEFEVGFLLNFGPKPQFKRFLMSNSPKKIRVHPCESVVGGFR